LPVAECSNVGAGVFAYTSFEADGKGNWDYEGDDVNDADAPTGRQVHSVATGNITRSGLTAGSEYIVSYWSDGSACSIAGTMSGYPVTGPTINGWTCYIHHVTGQTQVSLTGSGHIDELRLYPATATMQTTTYQPLVGKTSTCDVNNVIIYF